MNEYPKQNDPLLGRLIVVRILHSYCNHEAAAQRLEKIIDQARNGDRPPRTIPLPQSSKRLNTEQVDQILAAWNELRNIAAIARKLGRDYHAIRRHLHAAGIDTAWRAASRRRPGPHDEQIIQLHLDGQTIRQIAAIFGYSNAKVWTVIRDHKAAQAAVES